MQEWRSLSMTAKECLGRDLILPKMRHESPWREPLTYDIVLTVCDRRRGNGEDDKKHLKNKMNTNN